MDQRIDELRALLQDDPGSRRFFQLGELLRKENELAEAETVLRSGLEHHPRYVAAWISLGRIEFATTRWAEAERSYARALELDPENTVAARLIGETAEEQRQWERALKAYQLANMLAGRDPELDNKISEIQKRIAGDEVYDAPTEPDIPPGISEEVIEFVDDEFDVLDESEEVFAEPRREISPPSPQRELEVFSFSEEDPFSVLPTGNTGVWLAGDDVFSTPPAEPEPAPDVENVFGEAPEAIPEVVEVVEAEPELLDEPEAYDLSQEAGPVAEELTEAATDWQVSAEVDSETRAEEDAPGTGPDDWDGQGDVPLPTLTLARLAIGQNDVDLARRTLRSLLRKTPDDPEALALLAQIDGDVTEIVPPEAQSLGVGEDLAAAKSTVLRGWMDAIRLAAERRAP